MGTQGVKAWEEYKRTGSVSNSGNTAATKSGGAAAWDTYKQSESYVAVLARNNFINDAKFRTYGYINKARSYYESAQKDLDSMNWGNAADLYGKRSSAAESLRAEGDKVLKWLNENKTALGQRDYNILSQQLRNIDAGYDDILSAFSNNADFYGQFDTEEDYLKWDSYSTTEKRQATYLQNLARLDELKKERDEILMSSPEDLYGGSKNFITSMAAAGLSGGVIDVAPNDMRKSRTEEIDREINALEAEIEMYKRGNTDPETGFYYGSKVVDDYSQYLTDPNFEKYSGVRDYGDFSWDSKEYQTDYSGQYDVQDPLGMFLQIPAEERRDMYESGSGMNNAVGRIVSEGHSGDWDQLSQDEIGIYYTILGTQGKDAAMKYLSDMTTELNRRGMDSENEQLKQQFDAADGWERFGLSAKSIPAQIFGGAVSFGDDLYHTLAGDDINPYSDIHTWSNYAQNVRQNQTEAFDASSDWEIPGINFSAGDLYQAAMSTADMFGGAMLGPTAYGALMGMGAASSEARRLYEMGASRSQIAWGAAAAGAAEMLAEKYSIEKLISIKDSDTLYRLALNALTQGGIEASEEGVTELANLITNNLIMTSESDWARLVEKHNGDKTAAFWEAAGQVGSAAASGFASGLIGGTGSSAMNYGQYFYSDKNLGAAIRKYEGANPLRDLAMAMAEKETGRTQAALKKQSERVGKDHLFEFTHNRDVGRLYRTVQDTVGEANKADVANALQEKGYSKKEAGKIADAFYAQAIGLEVSNDQQKIIGKYGSDENVQKVIGDVLFGSDSSIARRNQNLRKFEFDVIRNSLLAQAQDAAKASGEANTAEDIADEIDGQETAYAVADDGKAHLVSNPEQSFDIVGFAEPKNGKVRLRTSDGQVVEASDVQYASESEAIVFETISGMDIPAKSANILIQAFRSKEGTDAEAYALAIQEAFAYGKARRDIAGMKFASALTPAELDYVYKKGQKSVRKQIGRQQAQVVQTVEKAKAVLAERGETADAEYRVILEDGITEDQMTTSQRAAYKMIQYIAPGAKADVHVYSGKTGEFGYFHPTTGDIYLNINSTRSQKSMMAFTMGHELVHRAKAVSPAKYQKFADFLIDQYGKQGASVEEMIAEQKAAAKDHGLELTRDQALEEVVADACQRMLLDTNAGKRLAEFGAQSKQNQGIVEDIKNWIREILDKLRSIFEGVEADSIAAREFEKFDANVKQILADMYVDMTIDAGENLAVIKKAFGKNTLVETNKNGEFTMAQNEDGSQKIFNLVTWENGGRETLEATLKREGYTKDEINAALTIMDGKRALVEKIANELDGDGKLAFPEQGRINEATLTTDIKDGHAVLSALVSNGDYPVNIDLLMVCKKRKAYQRVINRLCETGMIKQATVDALAIAEINKILGKYGFETACLGCFVESRRLRIQEWAQTIVKEWNGEVKKRDPNAKAFGFGKGEAKLTPDEVMQLIGELESGGEKNDKGNLNLGVGSSVKRMGVLLDKVPSLRKTLTVEDLITPEGLSSLRRFDSNLFSMVKSRYGSNSPKFVQEFNPYNHELAKYGKVPTQYKNLREYLYAIGGARMQSFSDFIVENWFDYCQVVSDLAARKLPMHTYTKEIAMVKLFGMTGIKINMSLIPDVDRTLGKEYAGLTRNADGKLELIWADKDRNKATGGKSYMQSINAREAFELQKDPRYSANIGTIAIGVSDIQIRMMLNDSRIRMVIPYHSSGMNPIYADMMGTSFYKDYTNVQNTTIKQIYNSKGQPVSLKLSKPQIAQLTGGFQFNEVLQEKGDARAAADAYKAWCSDASLHTITVKGETYTAELTPKFNDFADEANYYKLLEDFNTYDCITEQAAPQGAVQQIYPEGFEDILRAELSGQERYRQKQEKNQAFDKAMAEIESYLSKHTKADTVYYAQQQGIKLSKKDSKLDAADKERLKRLQEQGASFMLPKTRDSEYLDAVKRGDMETAQKMVDEAAKSAGFTSPLLFHGTSKFGFTKFDPALSDDKMSIFLSSNNLVAETYSGKTKNYKVSQRSLVTPEELDNASPETILKLLQENVDHNIEMVSEGEQNRILKDYRSKISNAIRMTEQLHVLTDLNIRGTEIVSKIVTHLKAMESASTYGDFMQAFDDYEAAMWDLRWEDGKANDILDRMISDQVHPAYRGLTNYLDTTLYRGNAEYTKRSGKDTFNINEAVSELYKVLYRGVYRLYTNPGNQFVIDAEGSNWNQIDGKHIGAIGPVRTRDVAKYANENGYDSVQIKNLRDSGDYSYMGHSDVYIFFGGNRLKSADPVTYDDSGNVIPLSRRFNAENDDIRYKLPIGEDTSPRALLTNALDSVITDPVEKQKLQEYRENIEKLNEQEDKLRNLKSQIKDLSFAPGPRDTQKIKALREEAAKTENRINLYDKRLLRFEASSTLQKVLQRERDKVRTRERAKTREAVETMRQSEREKYQQRIDAIKDRHKATKAKMTETRAKRDATDKLMHLVLDTARWIDRPKKGEIKVPDVLKKPYADFLNSIDLSSKRLAAGGDPTQSDLRLANAMSSLATTIERITAGQDPTKGENKALDSGYLDLPANFVQRLRDMTESITAMMDSGGHAVNAMSAQEVKEISKMIRTLNHAIREVSTLYANMRFANVQELGRESMGFMDSLGEIDSTRDSTDFIVWDNALPFYAFKRFGTGGESVFEGLMDAQDKLAFLAQEIFAFQEQTWNGKEAKEWSEDTHTIRLPSGESLTLTTADAMSIYCLSRRRQGLQHLLGGGVRVIGLQKGSKKAKDSRSALTAEDIDAISDSLNSRQKKVAEAIQDFMSSNCAEWGNEISMKRFLTREFTEEHYFPIESNTENMTTQDPTAQQSDLFRLLNISATKALTPNANNEVIIRNVFDVFTGHASDMARLNAFGMPLLDYMKWLNYREKTTNDQGQIDVKGVRKSMEKAYGTAAKQYVMNLIKDVNGRFSDGGDPSPLMKWMRSAKTASVGNSLRVATLQMTSYPRAALVLSNKNLALGLSKKPNIEKAKKYCGIALWKSFGFYDTNISRTIEDQMKGITDPKQKLIEWSLKGAEIGDALTWGYLWNACEYEVASTKKYKVGSEEFNEAVGKKLREVVYRTQVVDSMLTRSQLMRSKRGMAQEAAAFMSEPTLSANILMDAGFEFNMEKRRSGSTKAAWEKTGKYIGKAVAVYSIGQLTAALLESLWDAWRDDDDEEFSEKYLAAFKENLILDILPFNKIPIVSDVFEAVLSMAGIGFYSSDRMTTTWITNAVSAVDAWKDYFGDESNVTAYGAIFKSVKALSSYFGVSGSGLLREGVALWNNTAGAYDSTLKIRQRIPSKSQLGGELLDALIEGNDRETESLSGQFANDDEREKAIRAAIKSRFASGEIGEQDASKYLVLYGGLDGTEAHWYIEKWAFDLTNETGESYHKYDDFLNAVKAGENLDEVIDEYLQNGVSRTDLRKQITNGIRPEYIDATNEERDEMRSKIIAAMISCGYSEADAEEAIGEWDFEAEYGFSYSERKTAYLGGEVDAELLKKALVEYGGYDPKDADLQIQAYDWEAEGYEGVSSAAVKNYQEYCAPANVPKDIYLHIRKFANNTENDVVNGEKVPYSAVKKIMREINSQTGLTSAQKTAIARSIGWKDSTIQKYKLW